MCVCKCGCNVSVVCMRARVYMCFVWRQVCTCACMRVGKGVLTYRCIPVYVGCVWVCVYVTVARGTPAVTILLCCQLVPPTVLNRHACTHTRMHAHTHPDTHTHTTHTHTHTITGVQQLFCLLLCVYVMMVCTNAYVLLRSGLGIPC